MPKARESRTQSMESRQAASLARTGQALADNRPEALARKGAAEAIQNSPRVLQQRAFFEGIQNSPHLTTQRQRMKAPSDGSVRVIQRVAVKDTKVNDKQVTVEVGSDFKNNHMATDEEAAKTLSRGRVARSDKNTVVLDGEGAVKAALETAEVPSGGFKSAPNNFLTVSGLTAKKVVSLPKTAITPEAVTSQAVSDQNPVNIKYAPHRLAGNVVEASGVRG